MKTARTARIAIDLDGMSWQVLAGRRPRPCTSVAFTTDPVLIGSDAAGRNFSYSGVREQELALWDEGQLISGGSAKARAAAQAAKARHGGQGQVRPRTAVPPQ